MTDQASTADLARTALVPMGSGRSREPLQRKHASKKGRLANGCAQQRIANYGVRNILDRVLSGDTTTQIARDIDVSYSALATFLIADESHDSYARAKYESAEALLDKAMDEAADDPKATMAQVQLKRLRVQEYVRRAAIRNPRYSERNLVELSGPDGGPIQSQVQIAVYLPQNHRVVLDK